MTKKIFVTLLTLSCSFYFANAQIKVNSVLLGGEAYYNSTDIAYSGNQPNQKSKNAGFNISLGKALKENSVYGLNLSYSPGKSEDFYNGANYVSTKINQYNVGIFYRKYKKLAKDFYFFAEFAASYINSKQTDTDTLGTNWGTYKQSGGQITLTPGISYRILNKLHLEIIIPSIVNLQYTVTKDATPSLQSKQKQFIFNSSLNAASSGLSSLGVGFYFIL